METLTRCQDCALLATCGLCTCDMSMCGGYQFYWEPKTQGDQPVGDSDAAAREVDGQPDRDRQTVVRAIADCQATIKASVNTIRDANGELELLFAELGSMP